MTVLADHAGITDAVISGPFLVAGGLALAAGVVSFASPCVLPLVPGYLAYLAGLVGSAGDENGGSGTRTVVRSRAVAGALMFVAGYTVVFLAESLAVLGLAALFYQHIDLLTRIGGVVVIVMGLAMLGYI